MPLKCSREPTGVRDAVDFNWWISLLSSEKLQILYLLCLFLIETAGAKFQLVCFFPIDWSCYLTLQSSWFSVSPLLTGEESVFWSHSEFLSAAFMQRLSPLIQKCAFCLYMAVFGSQHSFASQLVLFSKAQMCPCPPTAAQSVSLPGASSEEIHWLCCEFAKSQMYPLSPQLLEQKRVLSLSKILPVLK